MELFNLLFLLAVIISFKLEVLDNSKRVFDVHTFNVLKGIAIVMVFVGHASKEYLGVFLYKFFCSLGAFAVPFFFFTSGFGLMYGMIHKKNYKESFLKRRILPIIVNYLLCVILFLIINKDYENIPLLRIICCDYYVPFSWYIFAITLLYFIFYISICITKSQTKIILISALLLCGYFFIKQILKDRLPLVGNLSMWAFVLGMLTSKYKTELERLTKQTYFIIFITSMSCFACAWGLQLALKKTELSLLMNCIYAISFPIMSLTFMRFFSYKPFSSSFWIFLKKISLQLYLTHGIVLYLMANYKNIPGEIKIFIVFALSVVASIILARLSKFFMYFLWREDKTN